MTGASLTLPISIRHARLQAAVVQGAELGNHVLFKTLSVTLQNGLKRSSRIKRRLFDTLAMEFGEPAFSMLEEKRFYCLSDDELVEAAFCLGLSFEISTLGSALFRHALEKLTQSCSDQVASKALKYAASVQTSVVNAKPRQPTTDSDVLAANGWSLLHTWACAHGINPDWRIAAHRTEKTNLGVMSRDNACALVQAFLADTPTKLGQD